MSLYLMQGHVYHSRSETAANSFKYPIFNLYFSILSSEKLQAVFRNKFKRLLGLKAQDYLTGLSDSPLAEKGKSFLEHHFSYKAEEIYLQTIPRMFGYAFNPVNFWYCYRGQKLDAVLCEVNNTFGETHYYWLYKEGEDLTNKWLQAEKKFHVSPFFGIEGEYRFRFRPEPHQLHVDIHYLNADGTLKLNTWVRGSLTNLEEVSVLKLIWHYGWLTPMVVMQIHYQAIKLFFKKVKFFKKPTPPQKEITYGTTFTRD